MFQEAEEQNPGCLHHSFPKGAMCPEYYTMREKGRATGVSKATWRTIPYSQLPKEEQILILQIRGFTLYERIDIADVIELRKVN